jgi:hypothetical protein
MPQCVCTARKDNRLCLDAASIGPEAFLSVLLPQPLWGTTK